MFVLFLFLMVITFLTNSSSFLLSYSYKYNINNINYKRNIIQNTLKRTSSSSSRSFTSSLSYLLSSSSSSLSSYPFNSFKSFQSSSRPFHSSSYSSHSSSSSPSSSHSHSHSLHLKRNYTPEIINSFYRQIREKNFYGALKQYTEELKQYKTNKNFRVRFLQALLNICDSEEHCLQILEELKEEGVEMSESLYLTLIRVNCQNGKPERAIEYINKLVEDGIQVRLRDFSPLIAYYSSLPDATSTLNALNILLSLEKYFIFPEPVHIIQLLNAAIKNDLISDPLFVKKFNKLLSYSAKYHYGFLYSHALEIVSMFRNISLEQAKKFGVLVRDINDVDGDVIHDNREENSTVSVKYVLPPLLFDYPQNDNFEFQEKNGSPTSYIPLIPLARHELDRYTVQESQRLKNIFTTYNAVICHISPHDSQCPNCNTILKEGSLSHDTKVIIKNSLLRFDYIERFHNWLSQRNSFEFVIDGANIAYAAQNYANGQFSFKQIEFVYDELIRQFGPTTKILVILPASYTKSIRYNSISRSSTFKTDEDVRILEKLTKADAIYLSPSVPGSLEVDDLHIIYATLYYNNYLATSTIAITNDFMRNHGMNCFPDIRDFYRWRKTQVANYTLLHESNTFRKQVENKENKFIIKLPGRHHSEIQYSKVTAHWHIPITDRNDTWLCFELVSHKNVPEGVNVSDKIENSVNYDEKGYEWKGEDIEYKR